MADKREPAVEAALTIEEIRAILKRASYGNVIMNDAHDSADYLRGVGKLAPRLPEYVEGSAAAQGGRRSNPAEGSKA